MKKYKLVTDRYGNPLNDEHVTIEELRQLCIEQGWEDTLVIKGVNICDDEGVVAEGLISGWAV